MTNKFCILMYHMISNPESDEEARYACPPAIFERHIAKLRMNNFNFVSMDDAANHLLDGKPLPDKSILITLDDGFEDNYLNAYPILRKFNAPATIFLTTGQLGGVNAWMTKRGYPERKLLNWDQIKTMSQNKITFGAHTVNHPKLPDLDLTDAQKEISESKNTIEKQLGIECNYFAYPFGLFSDENVKQVRNTGFRLACSTRSGFNSATRDPHILHRIEVYGTDNWWQLNQKITFGMNDASFFYPFKYYSGRIIDRFFH